MSQQITPMGTVVAADTREEAVRMFVQASMGVQATDYGVKLREGQTGAFRSHSEVHRPFSPLSGKNTAQELQEVPALSISRDTTQQKAYEAICGTCLSHSVASDPGLLRHCVVCGEHLPQEDEGEGEDVQVDLVDDEADTDFGVAEDGESVSGFEEAEDATEEDGEEEDDLSAEGDEPFYAEVSQEQIDELSEDALAELADAVALALGEDHIDLSDIDELPEDTRQVLNETYAEMFGEAEYQDEADEDGTDGEAAAEDSDEEFESQSQANPLRRKGSLTKSLSGEGCPMDKAEGEFEAEDEQEDAHSTSSLVEGEAEEVADAVSKRTGLKVSASDYLAWLGDGGDTNGGSYDKFDKAVRKLIPSGVYKQLERADLLAPGLEYALDLWSIGGGQAAKTVKRIFDSVSAAAHQEPGGRYSEALKNTQGADVTQGAAASKADEPLSVSSLSLAPSLDDFHLVYAASNVVGADRYYAIANGIPVAYATHQAVAEAHGPLYEAWGTENFAAAVSQMVEAEGAAALSAAGFTPFTYEVKAKNLVENAVASATKELEDTYKAEVKEVAEDVRAAISTAYVGLNKGFFKDREHPIKIDLFDRIHSVLCSSGFDEAQAAEVTASIIDSSFEQTGEDFGRTLMEAGFELLEMPREARNSLTKAIVGTSDQSPTNSVSSILSSRLGRFGR